MSDQPAAHAALWISMLVQHFPELVEELAPGRSTARQAPRTDDRTRPAADRRIRQERRDALLNEQRHGLAVPGYSAAPLRLHVSDAIRDITDGVVELEEAVRAGLGLVRPRRAPVPERLARIAALLDRIAAHPVLAEHVRNETRRMARRCARALGDTEAVVRIPGRCPGCDSVSLRAFPSRRVIVCINPACRCADSDCGCHDDPAYRHTWPKECWEPLAKATGGSLSAFSAAMDADLPAAAGSPSGTAPRGPAPSARNGLSSRHSGRAIR